MLIFSIQPFTNRFDFSSILIWLTIIAILTILVNYIQGILDFISFIFAFCFCCVDLFEVNVKVLIFY